MALYQRENEKSAERSRISDTSGPADFYNASPNNNASKFIVNDFDSIRAIEMREMQEEERYIQGLKMQREKIEQFRREVLKKDQRISELEEELRNSRGKRSEIGNLENQIYELSEQIKDRDRENDELRENIRKQVEEYERSLREMQIIVMKERDDKNKEMKALREQFKEKNEETTFLVAEVEKYKKINKQAEDRLDEEISMAKERDKHANEQLRTWKNFEKVLKDQISELSQEKNALINNIRELKENNEKLYYGSQKVQDLENALQKEKKKVEELKRAQEISEKEIKDLKSSTFNYKEKISEEFQSLNSELNRAIELISRQENTIMDLRMKSKEDESLISSLQASLSKQDEEKSRFNIKIQKLQQELEENSKKHTDFDSFMMQAKGENFELKKQIEAFREKERQEKLERKQFAKMKMELLSQRTAEVNKLTEAIDSFTNYPSY